MTDLRQTAADVIAWYRHMGVDALLGDEPVDWRARGDRAPGEAALPREASQSQPASRQREPAPAARTEASQPSPPARHGSPSASQSRSPSPSPPQSADARRLATGSVETALEDARARAAASASVADLALAIAGFDGCALKATAKSTCVYRGAEHARVMLIGEGPGRDEDREGRPFVGPAGRLLDLMLAAIDLTERDVHITNVVYWRPPGNRTPTDHETMVCRPFLERQIELVDPDVVVALGGAAAKTLLDVDTGIMKLRGRWNERPLGGRPRPLIATLHPAYLLRTPAAKRQAWRDLLAIRTRLAG